MENLADHAADTHPQTSSSSSSAPSSPSSSSSSSSSPSHPPSFASSPSSQKGLSAPSSSGSRSMSSSPFSGPSSPAHAAIDQASSSAQAHTLDDDATHHSNNHKLSSFSAAREFSEDTTLGFSANESHTKTNSAAQSSSVVGDSSDDATMGSSVKQVILGAAPATQAVKDNNGSSELTSLSEKPDDKISSGLGNDGDDNYTRTPAIEFKTEGLDRDTTADSSEAITLCNGTTSDDVPLAMFANGDACGGEANQAPTASDGYMRVDDGQDRASLQQNHDHDIENSNSGVDTGKTIANTSCHQDLSRSKNLEIIHSPDHTLNGGARQRAVNVSPESNWEPDNADSSVDFPNLRKLPKGSAVMLAERSLQSPVVKEAKIPLPNSSEATRKGHENSKDTSPDINELQRAKTMPSGTLEVIDGVVRPGRRPSFKRSITDKAKAAKENLSGTTGSKISQKKQEKILKRLGTLHNDGTVEVDCDASAQVSGQLYEPEEPEDSAPCVDDFRGPIVPLHIAMLIVGTRGDVQPFVAIGKRLQEYGHRVRLASHSNFKEFVLEAGLEFYPLGGDPKVLAGYMVKNKGFLPSGPSEVKTQRTQLKSIINSLLPACTCPDESRLPFKAQAIIANPPAYGHIHVAEALKVPLHIFFTMPWTPTSEFPHPLARVGNSAANKLSYQVVDSLIGWGMRGMINDFRKKKLNLRSVAYLNGAQPYVSKLPMGYIWSPHLVPKPKDWGPKIDVVGFCFLDLAQGYKPPDELVKWLASGPPPIYMGFGSLPVQDPSGMTKVIVEALKVTSQRGIISKGWGGLGTMVDLPESVYLLDNCPHDWLFSQCAAVVHHGGAGTTAAGLKAACPTTIVPFFGDQTFWGHRLHARGVGPLPIPGNQFSVEKLVHAIRFMMNDEVKERALELAKAIKDEDGVQGAVDAFHKHLPKDMPKPNTEVPVAGCSGMFAALMTSWFGSTES